ncbi:MAG: tRNA glutamyl-Q(34) synthetase GluQRS [Betaproteobacteria bacterium]|nr:tRNA glutamyl-Q(34) synthetase GluQRS [Betaproteobacteria bacterium]
MLSSQAWSWRWLRPDTCSAVSTLCRTAVYIGRFAPSPTGPLHAGSLVAALAGWLDARAHAGRWLVRIEDVDIPRCAPGVGQHILVQLQSLGLRFDDTPIYQSRRASSYQMALDALIACGHVYPCGCSRKDIAQALQAQGLGHERHAEWIYPGTCRTGLQGRPARAWRFDCNGDLEADPTVHWQDRRLGSQIQNVADAVGDFVLKRADGLYAYQLAVVVDDGAQGITHVVRGEDLADNTARQILLQRALHLPTPTYLHTPLVRAADGEKLSKQHGAPALDCTTPLATLNIAARFLGLPTQQGTAPDALAFWVNAWRGLYNPA